MVTPPKSEQERKFHRKTAVRCFNEAWDYLDLKKRTAEDDRMMLLLAHASRFHWGLIGTVQNVAVGNWLISRVYAALKQTGLSLMFARSAVEICEREKLSEALVAAYEAVGRAYAVARNYSSARRYVKKARRQLDSVDLKDEDKKVYLEQIEDTQRLIGE